MKLASQSINHIIHAELVRRWYVAKECAWLSQEMLGLHLRLGSHQEILTNISKVRQDRLDLEKIEAALMAHCDTLKGYNLTKCENDAVVGFGGFVIDEVWCCTTDGA